MLTCNHLCRHIVEILINQEERQSMWESDIVLVLSLFRSYLNTYINPFVCVPGPNCPGPPWASLLARPSPSVVSPPIQCKVLWPSRPDIEAAVAAKTNQSSVTCNWIAISFTSTQNKGYIPCGYILCGLKAHYVQTWPTRNHCAIHTIKGLLHPSIWEVIVIDSGGDCCINIPRNLDFPHWQRS